MKRRQHINNAEPCNVYMFRLKAQGKERTILFAERQHTTIPIQASEA